MTEAILRMKRGTITWSVKMKKYQREKCVYVEFSLNGKEFVNIIGLMKRRYIDEIDILEDIAYIEDSLLEKVPSILSTYGLCSLVETVGKDKNTFTYVIDVDKNFNDRFMDTRVN